MDRRQDFEAILQHAATIPRPQDLHIYLEEAVGINSDHKDPESLLSRLRRAQTERRLTWLSFPPTLILSNADVGGGSGGSGTERVQGVGAGFKYSMGRDVGFVVYDDFVPPFWEEVHERLAFIESIEGKLTYLENLIACDVEKVKQPWLDSIEVEVDSGRVAFRTIIQLGINYIQASTEAGLPVLLRLPTLIKDPEDYFFSSSVSEEVRSHVVELAGRVREQTRRSVAEKALSELRGRYEEEQSITAWWQALDDLRRKAAPTFCGAALLELSEDDHARHNGRPLPRRLPNHGTAIEPIKHSPVSDGEPEISDGGTENGRNAVEAGNALIWCGSQAQLGTLIHALAEAGLIGPKKGYWKRTATVFRLSDGSCPRADTMSSNTNKPALGADVFDELIRRLKEIGPSKA